MKVVSADVNVNNNSEMSMNLEVVRRRLYRTNTELGVLASRYVRVHRQAAESVVEYLVRPTTKWDFWIWYGEWTRVGIVDVYRDSDRDRHVRIIGVAGGAQLGLSPHAEISEVGLFIPEKRLYCRKVPA